jgi:CDP-ribitol ribitolphosphotransferase / teichoic acid ribitol-phosphate polymerase
MRPSARIIASRKEWPLSHPSRQDAGFDAPRIDLLSLAWERVQWIIEARPSVVGSDAAAVPATGGDPMAFRLRHEPDGRNGRAPLEMAPTRGTVEGDHLRLRFNVMQGPGQVPLAPGRWRLVRSASPMGTTAVPVVVTDPERVDPTRDSGSFSLGGRGEFRAVPSIDPDDGSISLDVSLEDPEHTSELAAPAASPLRRLLRPFQILRLGLFGVLFRIFRATTRRTGRRILFSSDSRAELGGNLKIVYDRMVERGLDREYELLTLFKPSVTERRRFLDRVRLPRLLARADVIVIDDYQPVIYRVDDPDVRIIQLWHAWGAFKTVGYSRVGKPGGPSPYSRIHKNYTHAIVSSDAEVPFYAEAFGIPEARVAPTGIPRMDRFFDPQAREAGRQAAYDAFPQMRGHMAILFAPTFRGNGAKSATYPMELLDYRALHEVCVEKDAVCIVRMHPFVREPLEIPEALRDRIIDGSSASIDVNDLLFAVDLVVTDYSSIVFEFSTQDRPMLFFAFDLEEYVASRDFYVDYRDFVPGRIVRTFDEMLDAIRRDDYEPEKLAAFRASHLDHFDGNATDRVIDLILET